MANIRAGRPAAAPPVSVQRSYLCWVAATVVYVIGSVISVVLTFSTAGQAAAGDAGGSTRAALTFGLVFVAVLILVVAGLVLLFARKMRAGRTWARITLTVFGVILALVNLGGAFGSGSGTFTVNQQVVDTGGSSTVNVVVAILTLLLLIAALVLQWLPDTRGWFAASATPQAPPPGPPPATP